MFNPELRIEKSFDAMGTTWAVVLYGRDEPRMEAAAAAAFDELHRIESLISIYDPCSDWSLINRAAAQAPVAVSEETCALLGRCLGYSRASEGAFDVSAGPLVEAWGFSRGAGRRPSMAEISDALGRVGYAGIVLDPAARTVRFERRGMSINPGGIGKGYAVERLEAVLRRRGFETGLIAASGSTICCMGSPPGKSEGWPVEIRNPVGRRAAPIEVFLRDMAVSTSGRSERAFWDGGRFHSHLIDPRTGRSARGLLQVSVIAPSATDAEAWTKPCFINGRIWSQAHLPAAFSALFFEDGPESSWSWHPHPPCGSGSSVDCPESLT